MSQMATSQRIQNLINFLQGLPTSESYGLSSNAFNDSKEDEKCADVKNEKFYLTTAINYTNGRPHIGHAYEGITSDVICRYHRIYGRDVWFQTGTDEHGQKVATTAESKGFTPKAFCDKNVAIFKKLNEELSISQDHFIRTTDVRHLEFCQKLWNRAFKTGDIYLSKYEGWYNVREEHYVPETEAKQNNYKDPKSGLPLQKNEEEAYFFRMSKYQDALIKHLKNNPKWILPQAKYNDILSRLSEPLEDLCVSRTSFDWGVPVPNNKGHVMYVWFDALSNYLSGIDYFENYSDTKHLSKFWPANVHVIGKDIVWFHCVIWPTMLLSCNIPLPKQIMAHGFVLDKNGEKMSKSLNNIIDPFDMLKKYKSDSLRYFICHQCIFGNDMKFNLNEFEFIHDSHLTKTYGNLVNRVLNLCIKYFKKGILKLDNNNNEYNKLIKEFNIDYGFKFNEFRKEIELYMIDYNLSEITTLIHEKIELCNRWLTEKEPWKLKNKQDTNKKQAIMKIILEAIYICTHFQEPFTPIACEKVFNYIGQSRMNICNLNNNFNNLSQGIKIKKGELLFEQFISKHETKQLNATKPDIACVEFVVGKILKIEKHPDAQKCYIEQIDIGEPKPRQIVSGLVPFVKESDLQDSLVIIFKNLKKSKIRQVLSEGMLLAASNSDKSIITPLRPPKGSKIGERVLWSSQDITPYQPDANLNIKKKNSVWLNISPKLRTNANGEACFDGSTLITSAGTVMSDVKDGQIS